MKTALIITIGVTLFSFRAHAQSGSALTQTVSSFEKAAAERPDEKAYLHLDKPYYAAGDDIWFKAYVTTGPRHTLSTLSKVLNVLLVNDKKRIEKAIKLPVINGVTWGDITLPDSLPEGNYHLIAYTNWMRNAGPSTFYNKSLIIGNGITNQVLAKADFKKDADSKLKGTVNYTDLTNTVLAGKAVNYEWLSKSKTLTRGKAQTDQNGNIRVDYTNSQPKSDLPDALKSEIMIAPGKSVVKTITINHLADKADLQFFPESGSLVNGVNSKVAFKAIGTNGLGLDVKGVIVDDTGTELATFASSHAGMGTFNFTPQSDKKYTAKVTFTDGSTGTINLPAVLDKGYVLSVNNTNAENISLRISTNAATLQENAGKEVSLIVQAGGKVTFAGTCDLQSQVYIVTIPHARFITGIEQFTLFVAGQPVNERLAFIQTGDDLRLDITSGQKSYTTRGKVRIDVNVKGRAGQLIAGNFSASVIDESKLPVNEVDESTIKTTLLLTSDLKGYVEQPNYYFINPNETTCADLDVLMLTQGYRKFSWKAMQAPLPAVAYQAEKGLNISGTVLTYADKPVAKAKVTLLLKKTGEVLDTLTDARGKFTFNNLIYTDTTKFVIQARDGKRSDVTIKMDPPPFQQIADQTDLAARDDISVAGNLPPEYLLNSKKTYEEEVQYGVAGHSRLLKEVHIKAKRAALPKALEYSNNLNGPGRADQYILGEALENQGGDLTNILRGKLTGVMFMGNEPISMANTTFGGAGGKNTQSLVKYSPMKVILDGMMLDYTYLTMLNPSDIGSIEVLRSAQYLSIYGSTGGTGLLVITTRHGGNTAYDAKSPGIVTYRPGGFYASREFYAPQYDALKDNSKMADLRTTVYWQPNMVTDKDGNCSFEFFNTDNKGTYRVVVEGIDNDGNLGRQVYHYKVD